MARVRSPLIPGKGSNEATSINELLFSFSLLNRFLGDLGFVKLNKRNYNIAEVKIDATIEETN